MFFTADESVSIPIEFEIEGHPFVPTVGSVTYTLRGHDGAKISGQTDIPVTTTENDTQIQITIDASYNTVAGIHEYRTLVVRFTNGTTPMQTIFSYRLTPFLNHGLSESDVRNKIGVDEYELPNHSIDLVKAYYEVEESITEPILTAGLADTSYVGLAARNLVLLKTCLNCLDSLITRLAKSEKSMNKTFERLKNFDLETVRRKLASDYEQERLKTTGQLQTEINSFGFSQSTDPLTGV